MHIKGLKVFCDVVGWRSFSRAADENGISQSGASQVVHQLEQRLGVKLIDRSKRPFVLTPEGETYYEGCRKLVQRYDALEDQVRTLHEEVAGRVRVVSIYSVGLHLMNRYLQQFLSHYPKANVRLEYQHPHRVYEAIEKDQADIGLVSYPRASRSIDAIPWREEPMVLVCSANHPLAALKLVELESLQDENFIGFDSDLTIRRELDRVLQLHDVEVRVVMEFDNVETMKRAVEIGAGVSILPQPAVAAEVAGGTLVAVPLATDELVRPLGIIHRRGKDLSSTTRRFIDLLQSEAHEPNAQAGPVDMKHVDMKHSDLKHSDLKHSDLAHAADLAHRADTAAINANPPHGDINGSGQRPVSASVSEANGHSVAASAAVAEEHVSDEEHALAAGGNGNGSHRKPAAVGTASRVKAK
ncbi:MAG TPA: LysR family transcriptional regulator [Pirellulales bacterium]|jgi:DNA-binding transcriptional LysR family regulator